MNALRRIAMAGAVATAMVAPAQAQEEYTIALIPGLTTDAFYITMHRGAQAAADALGVDLVFQGAPEFNPTVQVPVLDAVIARGPDAILIAPTDVTQLIEPLRAAHEAGIPVITVDTFIDDGMYQDGFGDGDFPIAYIASDNILGGMMAARALAESIEYEGAVYVSNVTPGISTTDQREEGFRLAMEEFPDIEVLETQFNDNDANTAASQLQAVLARNPDLRGVFGANLFSAVGAANGVTQAGRSGEIPRRCLRRTAIGCRRPRQRAAGHGHCAAPGRDRFLWCGDGIRLPVRPIRADPHWHRLYGSDSREHPRSGSRAVHLLRVTRRGR